MDGTRPVLYLVICAAPPCRRIGELVDLLHTDGWSVHAIATPTAATWLSLPDLERLTGHPVPYRQRLPDEPSQLPRADAIVLAPATFNTISKWATGINDSLALGVLNESLATGLPIVASVYAKDVLVAHPAFAGHLHLLASAGVRFTQPEALRPPQPDQPFRWQVVVDLLRVVAAPAP